MNKSVMDYVKKAVDSYPLQGNVLEVGSLNVNGTPRGLFADRDRFPSYLGVDMRPGPDVDAVMTGNHLEFPDESVGCLVCCEMLEHDARMWESVREFYRVLQSGGYAVITTCHIGKPRHDYPQDYWRFTDTGLDMLMQSAGFTLVEVEVSYDGFGVMGIWRKELAA